MPSTQSLQIHFYYYKPSTFNKATSSLFLKTNSNGKDGEKDGIPWRYIKLTGRVSPRSILFQNFTFLILSLLFYVISFLHFNITFSILTFLYVVKLGVSWQVSLLTEFHSNKFLWQYIIEDKANH